MDDERVDAGRAHRGRHRIERRFRILIVDTDPALHRDGDGNRRLHRRNAIADERRLAHQAGPEGPALDAIGRAAAIQVNLVIAEIGADLRRLCQQRRIVAAELERDRMLDIVETDQPLPVTADHSLRRHHLGIEPGAARHQAMDDPAMPISPVHHRRHGESM